MRFSQYKTADELYEHTGLTIHQALRIVDLELEEFKKNNWI